jgi:hypothetical protein
MSDWPYYFLCLPITAMVYRLAKTCQYESRTIAFLLGAMLLYYFCIYSGSVQDFTLDYPFHLNYVQYIAADFFNHSLELLLTPYDRVDGPAFYQLAPYYIVAAPFYMLGEYIGMDEPVHMARHLSLMLYMGFIFFAIQILRTVLIERDMAYYASLAMLLLWPVGVTMAGVVHPDVIAYCFQIGAVYHLIYWLNARQARSISNAFFLAAIGLQIKNTSFLYLLMAALCFALAIYENRANLSQLFTRRLILSLILVGCSVAAYEWRMDMAAMAVVTKRPDFWETIEMFGYFNPFTFVWDTMLNPRDEEVGHFWHFFLRTLLIGPTMGWKVLALLFAMGVLFLAQLIYILVGLIWRRNHLTCQEKRQACFFFILGSILVGAAMVVRYNRPEVVDQSNARYIYPIIIILIVAYGKVMAWYANAGREVAARIGNGLVVGMSLVTLALFLTQYSGICGVGMGCLK